MTKDMYYKYPFRTSFAHNIFMNKYAQGENDTWFDLSKRMVESVCQGLMTPKEKDLLFYYHSNMKWIAGGRYLYYAGRKKRFYNNCFLMRCEEDTREEWGRIIHNSCSALMSGGGIGIDYSILRGKGHRLSQTGGISSGPISLMQMVNEVGRHVMQGGSRRSAMYASLNWKHQDIYDFLKAKNWSEELRGLKEKDFNFPAPLDMTNISINWDTEFLSLARTGEVPQLWFDSVKQMMKTGEPGHSYNFFENEKETLRNAPVSGDTLVLTNEGYKRIHDIKYKKVKVWTGKQFAETVFNKTAESAEIIEVYMSNGRMIKAEPSHPFMVERRSSINSVGGGILYGVDRVPARELKINDTLHYSHPDLIGTRTRIRVVGLSEGAREDVYCCDVKVPEHTFMADGVIISNCAEVTSEDDSDVCNLSSINLSRIENIEELKEVTALVSKFLVCGTITGELPYDDVYKTRDKNRRIGVGLMGVHEWLLQRGYRYEFNPEFESWLSTWKYSTEAYANAFCDTLGINRPVKYRAIAPTGTIGIIASTTTGIEPLLATAYKRRYLVDGTNWKYQYVVDATADAIIKNTEVDSEGIETAYSLALDPERRVKFQYHVQKYVDHGISSTLNLPAWGTEYNNEDKVKEFSDIFLRYSHGLRGLTVYPDGARGGQPIEEVDYKYAMKHKGVIFDEIEEKCSGGICGI